MAGYGRCQCALRRSFRACSGSWSTSVLVDADRTCSTSGMCPNSHQSCRAYDGSVAGTVTADLVNRQLVGEGWSLRADRLEPLNGNDWRALIGVRRGLKLLVSWSDQAKDVDVAAWAGEPEKTDGVAVVGTGSGDLRVARVPLCACGDRGCGNVGIQFAKWLRADSLPALVQLLRELPWTDTIPTRSNVLKGNGLSAIEDLGSGSSASAVSYPHSPRTVSVAMKKSPLVAGSRSPFLAG